jgi:predicted ArsR family transcriptional regulator
LNPLAWERIARAHTHPLRVSILEVLSIDGGRTMTPADIARELQVGVNGLNYHVLELAKKGLIELVRESQVRGATAHFYRLASPHNGNEAASTAPEGAVR